MFMIELNDYVVDRSNSGPASGATRLGAHPKPFGACSIPFAPVIPVPSEQYRRITLTRRGEHRHC